MNRLVKTLVLSVAAAATVLAPVSTSFARDGYKRHHQRYEHRHRSDNADALALGVIGLAAGMMVGAAISQPRAPQGPVYIDPPRHPASPAYSGYAGYDGYGEPDYRGDNDYYPPVPAPARNVSTRAALEPWSPAWRDYCAQRYRSFDSRTGTYTGYDGQKHFCTAS